MFICYRQVFACKHREANQIKQWKDQLFDGVTDVFDDKPKASKESEVDIKSLHAKIGQRPADLENDFWGLMRDRGPSGAA
jgi:hypothetical protein